MLSTLLHDSISDARCQVVTTCYCNYYHCGITMLAVLFLAGNVVAIKLAVVQSIKKSGLKFEKWFGKVGR